MNEDRKKEIATFRFNVISDLVMDNCLSDRERGELIRRKASRRWKIPYSKRETISETTIRRWIDTYERENKNITSLYPKDRADAGDNRCIGEEAAIVLMDTKRFAPNVPIIQLYHDLIKSELLPRKAIPSLSTIYRFFRGDKNAKLAPCKVDRRRYEAESPNDIWQSDVMYGPKLKIEGKVRRTYLIAFIDDHSRIIPNAAFYPDERIKSYLDALKGALLTRGVPRKLYVDNGAAFKSKHLEYVMAALRVTLIRAKPYSPQGKGKIERFFRTVRSSFLSSLAIEEIQKARHPLMEINERLSVWIEDNYHRRPHSSIGETPIKRFADGIAMVRPAPDNLADYFRLAAFRTVTKDRVIHLEGKLYEAPIDLAGERVELLYHADDKEEIEVRLNGNSYGFLRPVDLGVNAKVRRGKSEELTTLKNDNNGKVPTSGRLFAKKGGKRS